MTASKGYEEGRRRNRNVEAERVNKGRGRETVKQLDSAACLVYRYWEMRFMRI